MKTRRNWSKLLGVLVLCLALATSLAPSLGIAAGAEEAGVAADAGAIQPGGSITSAFSEGFEGAFPTSKWWVEGDTNANSGEDYWDDVSYRSHGGSWSGWCAGVGTNSLYADQANTSVHKYDVYMDSSINQNHLTDMTSTDFAYLDFWAWCDTESTYDYVRPRWFNSATWLYEDDSSRIIQGTSGWTRYYWQMPYNYMTGSAGFGFRFRSDFLVVREGVYLDDISLMQADVTVGSDSHASATAARPGDTIILSYRIHNPSPISVSCGLGASIVDQSGALIWSDSSHDTVVTIPPGLSTKTREFTVPTTPSDGLYDILYTIWSGTPNDTSSGNRVWGEYRDEEGLRVDSIPPWIPGLLSPANGAVITDSTPTLDWGDLLDPTGVSYHVQLDNDSDFSTPIVNNTVTPSQYTVTSTLADGRYYWRVASRDGVANFSDYSGTWYFDVSSAQPPAVTTNAADPVGTTTATLRGTLSSRGSAAAVWVSFEWGQDTSYGTTTTPQSMTAPGAFSAPIDGLTPGATYHFRAKAVGDGTVYGSDVILVAGTTAPTVTTGSATAIGSTAATLNGNLSDRGTATSVEVAFEWGPDTSYGNVTTAETRDASGAFSYALDGLASGATYHFRARAVGDGTSHGSDMTFTTTAVGAPVVTTGAATAIGPTTATLNGNLSDRGTASTVEVSFEWGTSTAYGSITTPEDMTATGAFSAPLTGLISGTTYHFRTKAVGDGDPVYGSDMTFTTGPEATAPAVTTDAATAIGSSTATLNGNLSDPGTAASVQVSFEWGTTTSYGSTATAPAMTAAGPFSATLSGLAPATLYHFRAKAVGDNTTYGEDLTFTTSSGAAASIQNVTANSGRRGEDLTIRITGSGLTGATAVNFGNNITVREFSVVGDGEISARISIDDDAALGSRDVAVTTAAGTNTMMGAFTVNEASSRIQLWVYLVAGFGGLLALVILVSLAAWAGRQTAGGRPPAGGGPQAGGNPPGV